eukprot:1176979-Prymnesium_polylepis.1
MSFFELGGVRLCYELKGAVHLPRLLVLSPSNTSIKELKPYFESLTNLTASFLCLFVDHRGTGLSSMPSDDWPDPPAVSVYADDALAILDHLGWQKCHVLGLSFGGMVAQEVSARAEVFDPLLARAAG